MHLNESNHTAVQLIHACFIPSQLNTHTYFKPFLDKKEQMKLLCNPLESL